MNEEGVRRSREGKGDASLHEGTSVTAAPEWKLVIGFGLLLALAPLAPAQAPTGVILSVKARPDPEVVITAIRALPEADAVAPAAVAPAVPPCPTPPEKPVLTLESLKYMNARELEQLFAEGEAAPVPAGFSRGQLLVLCGYRFPRMSIQMAGLVWKGKHFTCEGHFINQWVGFRALHSQGYMGPSVFDGKPCVVLEYPPGTPLFENARDEARQIGPCLFLCRVVERYPHPRLRGFIAMQPEPDSNRKPWNGPTARGR